MNWALFRRKGSSNKYAMAAILSVLLLIGGVFGVVINGSAHEASIYVETIDGTAKRLDEFTVKIKIESPEPISMLHAYLSYNSDVIEFVSSNTDSIVGTGGTVKITDTYPEGATEEVYELKFRALELGISNLNLYDIKAEGAENAEAVQLLSKSSAVEVVVNRSEPSDARLYELLVANGKLKPDFNPNTYEYSIKVPYEVETFMFSAQPMNEESVVELEQKEKLDHGDNIILIKVTSPSGVIQTYTLNVYRALTEDEILDNVENGKSVSEETPDQTPDQTMDQVD
ncbi:cadherin-like beta sandwich domain-containing protein [Anaerosacchariphilus polymeriproducens]|uniref:Cadherin-like beta-sandwich-like domain-containing protein n=1 Tax=Anaerosacchariphilus polymeriproducens TaxID=1812858 RepID=A0A371ARC7_9FIRM|nr:cadherin-like beta sandwich domain-containing protein [Anaerosacchariphilus polymeriproducens]RDU22129.1 hypothetical protein DWV06_16500 [Anaerosacchariphilus polymeriproducens]